MKLTRRPLKTVELPKPAVVKSPHPRSYPLPPLGPKGTTNREIPVIAYLTARQPG